VHVHWLLLYQLRNAVRTTFFSDIMPCNLIDSFQHWEECMPSSYMQMMAMCSSEMPVRLHIVTAQSTPVIIFTAFRIGNVIRKECFNVALLKHPFYYL
jgi:hypothetical protein